MLPDLPVSLVHLPGKEWLLPHKHAGRAWHKGPLADTKVTYFFMTDPLPNFDIQAAVNCTMCQCLEEQSPR